jgi:hypothetical protein
MDIKSMDNKSPVLELIPIPCTDREKFHKLRSLLIEIQSQWFDNLFDSGLTFADPAIWEKMQAAICLMERRDNPSQKGFDLKTIASDYKLLEQIFIAKHWEVTNYILDDSSFVGCDLIRIHHFSAIGILKEVVAFIANRNINPIDLQIAEIKADPTLTLLEQTNKIRALYDVAPLVQTADGLRTEERALVDSYPDEDEAYEIISKGIDHE